LTFPEGHEVLEGLHGVDVINDKILKCKFTSAIQQKQKQTNKQTKNHTTAMDVVFAMYSCICTHNKSRDNHILQKHFRKVVADMRSDQRKSIGFPINPQLSSILGESKNAQ